MPTATIGPNLDNATNIFRRRLLAAFAVIYRPRAFTDVLTCLENRDSIAPGSSSETFVIEMDKDYGIDQPTLAKLVREKNLEKLDEFGGVEGIAHYLNSDIGGGINGDDAKDILRRIEAFGKNTNDHRPPSKVFFHFVWEVFRDPPIATLLACATVALGFGIKGHGRREGWYDGGSMFIAVLLVIFVSATSNFRQNRQFDKLSKVSNNVQIEVVRNGRRQQISIVDLVVGDVVCLKAGDQVPADGLFIDEDSLRVDESSMTCDCDNVEINRRQNPFLILGTKVADGYGRMLVTAVGMNSTLGETMASDTLDFPDKTPLQDQLNKLSSAISIIGSLLAFVTAVVGYVTRNKKYKTEGHDDGLNVLVEFIATTVNTAVVAIPGGLPLAFTLTLSYSVRRIMANKVTVRKLSACETVNSVTTICIGKGGSLTESDTMVTKFWLGNESIGKGSYTTVISSSVLHLLHQAVLCLNKPTSVPCENEAFSLNSIEKAISSWAELELEKKQIDENFSILQEFSSERRRSGVLIKKNVDNTIHVHWRGAAEMILEMCSCYYHRDGDVRVIKDSERQEFIQIIRATAASSLQCVALAHKQILEANHDDGEIKQELQEKDLILLGIIGLKDPCKQAVKDCQDAGVNIKMITGDDILKAEAIATEVGLLGSNHEPNDGSAITSAEFCSYTDDVQMEKVDRIVVMAGSSPFDKNLMVKLLKRKKHVVAVIGDGEKDARALKEADIGFLMGIQGTKVSKENADIIIPDDNFSSVVRVLRWGRCTYNNIQKFTQFQLTANISGILINFVTAVSAGRVPLTAIEALWVNVIINPLGALALATERLTKEQTEKPLPVGQTEPLITNIMWRNLLGQAVYQIGVILALQFRGESVFGVSEKVNDTLVYNTFVLCQVFNELNGRRLERMNIFEGIHRNKIFLGIVGIQVTLQVVLVEFLKRFADTERLDWGQWAACAGIAGASWPVGLLIKFIPVPEKPLGI